MSANLSQWVFWLLSGARGEPSNEKTPIRRRWQTRQESEAQIRHILGELTPEEELAGEEAERQNYNRQMELCTWWSGGDWYVDYDGNRKEVGQG